MDNRLNSTPMQKYSDLVSKKVDYKDHDEGALSGLMEIEELEKRVVQSKVPNDLKHRALKMVQRLKRMASYGSYSGEYEIVEKYADWIVSIPWGVETTDNLDLKEVKSVLDANHYGIEAIKYRIIEYLAVMKLKRENGASKVSSDNNEKMVKLRGSSSNAPIICFVGLQGIGKTSMAKSIAQAMGRKFSRISLGALGSVYELRGRSRAFLDAEPGRIVKSLIRTGVTNPLILLDEIDKVSGEVGLRADVMAALLEILDPEQNSAFVDHYIDYPIDLSNVMFITTANNLGGLSAALLDRLEIVRFSSYTDDEKKRIAIDYLLPKVLESSGLRSTQLQFEEEVWPQIIRPFGFDSGVRELERTLSALARKVARRIVEGDLAQVKITRENFKEFMPDDIGVLS